MIKDVDITGNLVKVTESGRYGVIKLAKALDGLRFAVINDSTHGRILLMNRLGGPLVEGAQVRIRKLETGSEAFVARQVE